MNKLLSIEQALKQGADENNAGRFSKYQVIKDELLNNEYIFTLQHFPGGNDHGPNHINRVKKYLNELVKGEPLKKLSNIELFVLLCALHFHDIGMMRGRKNHPTYSKEMLHEHSYNFALEEFERRFIGLVVECHGSTKKIENVFTGYSREEPIGGETLRPRYLAALLRLADELDEDHRRAKSRIFINSNIPESSIIFWLINLRIQAVKIDKASQKIAVTVNYWNKDLDLYYSYGKDKKVNVLAGIYFKMQKLNDELLYCMRFMEDGINLREVEITFRNEDTKKRQKIVLDNTTHSQEIPEELIEICKMQEKPLILELNPDEEKTLSKEKPSGEEEIKDWFDLDQQTQDKISKAQPDFVRDALEVINRPELLGQWSLTVKQPQQDAFLNLEFNLFETEKTPSSIKIIIFPIGEYPIKPPKIDLEDNNVRESWDTVQAKLLPLQAPHLWKTKYRALNKHRLFHIAEQIAYLQNSQELFKYHVEKVTTFLDNHFWTKADDKSGETSIIRNFNFRKVTHQIKIIPTSIYPRKIPDVYCTPILDQDLWGKDGMLDWTKVNSNQSISGLWKEILNEKSYLKHFVKTVENILDQNYS